MSLSSFPWHQIDFVSFILVIRVCDVPNVLVRWLVAVVIKVGVDLMLMILVIFLWRQVYLKSSTYHISSKYREPKILLAKRKIWRFILSVRPIVVSILVINRYFLDMHVRKFAYTSIPEANDLSEGFFCSY